MAFDPDGFGRRCVCSPIHVVYPGVDFCVRTSSFRFERRRMTKEKAAAVALVACSFVFLFWDVLAKLVSEWSTNENYSHGFLMVPVAAYVVWRQRAQLAAEPARPSMVGLAMIIGSVLVLGVGRLGAESFVMRLAVLGTLAGVVAFLWGFKHLRALAFAFLLLFLAIPIPGIIFNQIAFPLQLLASRFGELTISACQIPVLREGNVIVLASTTLEVAEACSGIRSLVSLVALAVIWGYLAESPTWLRWLLACAAVPIAIFANGFRVAGTGIAAHFVGPEAAQGFFHMFSGWLVFVVAGALLLLVHRLALWLVPSALTGRRAESLSGSNEPARRGSVAGLRLLPRTAIIAVCLVGAALGLRVLAQTETTPLREPLTNLPTQVGSWSGRDAPRFSKDIEAILGVDEYLTRDYTAPGQPGVGLFVGYRESQRQGQTMHTPLVCLPGAGWEATSRDLVKVQVAGTMGSPARTVEVNRMVAQKGLDQLLVVYWYQGRGRIVASEYWVKVYGLVDAIRLNRSDGAIVRLVTPIDTRVSGAEQEAERASLAFASRLLSVLGNYLPD